MLDWFTTIPGILIICGVILLLIAIILFVAGAKKTKKENSTSVSTSSVEAAASDINNTVTISNVDNTVVDTIATPSIDNTVVNTIATPSVDNTVVDTIATPNVDNTVVDTIATPNIDNTVVDTIVTSNVDNTAVDAFAMPNIENTHSVTEDNSVVPITLEDSIQVQEPQQELFTSNLITPEPVIENSVVDMPNFSQVSMQETDNSAVYGGNTPVVNFNVPEEKPVTIYGGNDPLEATQSLPKMEMNHEPYGGNYPEARIVEPVASIEVPTPVEETITPMPTMEPTAENVNQQSVIEIPDLDSVSPETSTVSPVAEQNMGNSTLTVEQQPITIEEL